MSNHIYHDIAIKADANSIFHMVTHPDGLNKWWTTRCEGEPLLHSEYRFYFSDEFDWKAQVTKVSTDSHIEFLITEADADWTNTQLIFQIIPLEIGSNLLRFEHKNWKSPNDHFRRSSMCWAEYIMNMKKILES